jgi:hypothetical protein
MTMQATMIDLNELNLAGQIAHEPKVGCDQEYGSSGKNDECCMKRNFSYSPLFHHQDRFLGFACVVE